MGIPIPFLYWSINDQYSAYPNPPVIKCLHPNPPRQQGSIPTRRVSKGLHPNPPR